MGVLLIANPAATADDKDDLEDVQKEKKDAAHDLHDSSQEYLTATKALKEAKVKLAGARQELTEVENKLDKATATHQELEHDLDVQREELDVARLELDKGTKALGHQRAVLRDLILDIYQEGDPALLEMAGIASGDITLEEIIRYEAYEKDVTATEDVRMQRVEAKRVALQKRERKVEKITEAVAANEKRARKKVQEISRLRESKIESRDKVRELVDTRADAQQRAERLRERDRKVLEELKEEEARLQKLIANSAEDGSGDTVGDLSNWLLRPVDGPITSSYGMRTHPITGETKLHDGTDFGADCGTALAAVDGGKVIDAYYNDAWGNRVLIALGKVNGNNYTAIYNHLSSDSVSVGQTVSRGDTIGAVGTTGWSTGCHLHFTLMRDGATVDPMNYMS